MEEFTWTPSYPVKRQVLYRTLHQPFERGKEQRLAMWANPKRLFTLVFKNITPAKAREIYEFYIARKGSYESFRITDWKDYQSYRDPFDNSSIGGQWTEDPGNGTITEDTALHLVIADTIQGIWQGAAAETTPRLYQALATAEYQATVKLNSYTVNEDTQAGIALFLDRANAYLLGRLKDTTLAQDGLYLAKIDPSQYAIAAEHVIQPGNTMLGYGVQVGTYYPELLAGNSVTTLPVWLRVAYKDSSYTFSYSTDGSAYTTLYTLASSAFTPTDLGPFARNWGGYSTIDASFNDFIPDYYRTVRFLDDSLAEELISWLRSRQGIDLIEVF